ncbi:hypothetical protein [Vibrio cyclitrophicus]|uniref:Uncharacterized protein n=1 Tax=Vibrio cyclitrophicus TaxID=47951 RepID=A0ACD5G4G9_9VIBR|nr:hypothetical protein [Vibrio cyclitrophicus]
MSDSKEQRLQVANTILMQLGGRRFSMMTGAKQFVAIERGLLFALPARLAKQGINKMRIELEANDTYTVTALKVNARQVMPVKFNVNRWCTATNWKQPLNA